MAKTEKFGVLIEGKETVSKAAQKAEKGLGGLVKGMAIATAAGHLLLDMFRNIGRAITDFVRQGIDLALSFEGVEAGFRSLASSSGQLLKDLKKATAGTVAQIDLMKQANQALLLGIDQEALVKMFKGAAIISQATGQDITFAIESITTGLGRQSRLMLDNLGIMVKAGDAQKAFADSLGVATSALSQQQKTFAFTKAAMDALVDSMSNLGGEILPTTKLSVEKLNTELAELKRILGDILAPKIKEVTDNFLTPMVTKIKEWVFWVSHSSAELSEFYRKMEEGGRLFDDQTGGIEESTVAINSLTISTNHLLRQTQLQFELVHAVNEEQKKAIQASHDYETGLISLTKEIEKGNLTTKESIELWQKLHDIKKKNLETDKEISDFEHARAIGFTGGIRGAVTEGASIGIPAVELADGRWGVPTQTNPAAPSEADTT